ncbi:MAG: hypothetical protein ABTD50_07405 [Polyangiaceae bacterium]
MRPPELEFDPELDAAPELLELVPELDAVPELLEVAPELDATPELPELVPELELDPLAPELDPATPELVFGPESEFPPAPLVSPELQPERSEDATNKPMSKRDRIRAPTVFLPKARPRWGPATPMAHDPTVPLSS